MGFGDKEQCEVPRNRTNNPWFYFCYGDAYVLISQSLSSSGTEALLHVAAKSWAYSYPSILVEQAFKIGEADKTDDTEPRQLTLDNARNRDPGEIIRVIRYRSMAELGAVLRSAEPGTDALREHISRCFAPPHLPFAEMVQMVLSADKFKFDQVCYILFVMKLLMLSDFAASRTDEKSLEYIRESIVGTQAPHFRQ